MDNKEKNYTLCGGTFLLLLIKARKLRIRARQNAAGERDGLSESELFEALIQVADPDFYAPAGNSMKTYTSEYKACRLSANDSLPFDSDEFTAEVEKSFFSNYNDDLLRMCAFSERFLNEKMLGNWLVRALMETVYRDPSIGASELFYTNGPENPVSKADLTNASEVYFQPFLLGIWFFILSRRPDNKAGIHTVNEWLAPAETKGARRKFCSDVGKSWDNEVMVNYISADDAPLDYDTDAEGDVPDGMDALCTPSGIAPELTGEAPWVLIPKGILEDEEGEFSTYLNNAYDKYSHMKTLLYSDAPRDFYQFFICSDVSYKVPIRKSSYAVRRVSDASVVSLRDVSNFILLTGTGGLGKSMMLRHLLLDAVSNYDTYRRLPLLVPLKDYSSSYDDLESFMYEKFEDLDGTDDPEVFHQLLDKGIFVFLLDGMDEIKTDFRKKFEHDLDVFTDKYRHNMFIISSRPVGSFVSLNRFTVLELCPFTKEQAVELIDKLDFRPDAPEIKEKFRKELDQSLFVTHRSFTENPLLLTIMLMTFEQFAEIPSKMHVFYHEAYVALSQKHDASKGAYKRVLRTGLTADQFSDFFAEFCARTYRDEKFEFTDLQFDNYYKSMHAPGKMPYEITAEDFRRDLVDNMCLMFCEGGKYFFTHRSFQEYFCALYFSKQKDRTLEAIGNFFENKRSRNYTDKTFDMLYDMIPEKIEEYIFEPYLASLLDECSQEEGYWTFLRKMYPVLYYEEGDTQGSVENTPESFLFGSAMRMRYGDRCLKFDMLPRDRRFVTDEWVYIDDDYPYDDFEPGALVEEDEISWEYQDEFGEPEIAGRDFEMDVNDILGHREKFSDVMKILDSDDFPLKQEYENAEKYRAELTGKHRSPQSGDLFDLFD